MEEQRDVSASCTKPSHVRKLNFGQSILTLNVVNQFGRQRDGRLLIDHNVATIPCTEKGEFVRKWIETHGDPSCDSNDESSRSSPILAASETNRLERSPIIGKPRKRARGKTSLNDSTMSSVDRVSFSDINSRVQRPTCSFLQSEKRQNVIEDEPKENIEENFRRAPFSPIILKAKNANVSPILDRNSYSYKRRRRKDREKYLQSRASNATGDGFDSNMNSVILQDVSNVRCNAEKMVCTQRQRMLIKELEKYFDTSSVESGVNEDSKVSEDSVPSYSPVSEAKINIEDSPQEAKDNGGIEIDSSKGDDSNDCKNLAFESDDNDKTLSDQIEDVDTQDTIPPLKKHCPMGSLCLTASCTTSIQSQTSNKDSDRTFYSKGEEIRYRVPSIQNVSQKISQISSQTNVADLKSNKTDIIMSNETSPLRTHSDPAMLLNILDSGKKRRKPKKGSLSERLQSLISREVSFVRIWRHQMKAAKDNASVQCVTVYVQKCVTYFGRQFLEGFPVKDPFDLLPFKGSHNSLTIMTIPDIVGKIEMRSEGMVQIFPPWEILNSKKTVLSVTYINIISKKEKFNIESDKMRKKKTKELIVKEFDCPCIKANKLLPICKERFDKPNLIESLFST